MGILSGCRPEKVFQYFELLCSVPHGSKNTRQISELCANFAREQGLEHYRDELNNVIIYKEASAGYEGSEPVILQGHIDMVCSKEEGCPVDMEKEGITPVVEGDWIRAEGTTLGADNGVAVAMIMAILSDESLPHPPIEAVFTVDEETGMEGAIGLDTSRLKAKRLINLDSEDEGIFTAGCAGGRRLNCSIPVARESAEGLALAEISISGLVSGHSGVDINKGRGSSNRLMGRMLFHMAESLDIRLVSMEGGELDNVIPKLTEARIAIPASQLSAFFEMAEEYDRMYKNELSVNDPCVTVSAKLIGEASEAVSLEDTKKALTLMIMLPYHVQEMSMDIKDLVQTSLNMGVLKMTEKSLDFSFSVRSCVTSQKDELIRRVKAIVAYMGGHVSEHGDYPAWQFAKVSPLRETVLQAYRELYGKDGIVSATHGGLECGLFMSKIDGLDCISFGPEMHDVHSPKERLSISSTERIYSLVCEILKKCK